MKINRSQFDMIFKKETIIRPVEMITMSAGMGERFAQTATDITEKIRNMGPSPVKNVQVGKAQSA